MQQITTAPGLATLPNLQTWKVLSVRQPWAHLIIHHGKDVENRTWRTHYRGPLLIHASKTFDMPGFNRVCRDFPKIAAKLPHVYPTGGIVGWTTVTNCKAVVLSDWFEGPWGMVLENSQPLEFIPIAGKLGLWDFTPEPGQLRPARR